MAFFKDKTGEKYGRLTILSLHSRGIHNKWNCICECGNQSVVKYDSLRRGATKSCGCLRNEVAVLTSRANFTKHGLSDHPLYGVWGNVFTRCYNPKVRSYKDYGGRGIRMCEEWKNSPEAFIRWGLAHGWEKGLEIDRRENDMNYEPDNCRFVTSIVNVMNRRVTIRLELDGVLYFLSELETMGAKIPKALISQRINRHGWSVRKAVYTPINKIKNVRTNPDCHAKK